MVKKTMAAGMLALIACTSMSAMAEPQWVKVDNLHYTVGTESYSASSWEEICQGYAEKYYLPGTGVCIDYNTNCHQFAGSVLSYSGGSLVCSSFQTGDKKYSVNTTFCPQGQKRVEGVNGLGSFGCYEYIDCDTAAYPDGKIPEACNPPIQACPDYSEEGLVGHQVIPRASLIHKIITRYPVRYSTDREKACEYGVEVFQHNGFLRDYPNNHIWFDHIEQEGKTIHCYYKSDLECGAEGQFYEPAIQLGWDTIEGPPLGK